MEVNIKTLLEAGVHFGHQTERWNPKMAKFIFGERNGIYIIDLEKTLACLERALKFIEEVTSEGKSVLFVGTKKQAQISIEENAVNCGMPYVNQRWLGGMLTNFETVRKSVSKIEKIEQMEQDGTYEFLTKKEISSLKKEKEKLDKNLRGVRELRRLPGAVFIIDPKREEIALHEAVKLGIPVIALIDTNGDPDNIDYPVPGNDDAIRSIKFFCEIIAETIRKGRSEYEKLAEAEAEVKKEEEEKKQSEESKSETENKQKVEAKAESSKVEKQSKEKAGK